MNSERLEELKRIVSTEFEVFNEQTQHFCITPIGKDLLALIEAEQRRVAVTDEGEAIDAIEALWRLDDICFLGDDPTGRDRKALDLAITALEQYKPASGRN
jgi:hypothetical protein